MRNKLLSVILSSFALTGASQAMEIGTNFWFLASWSGEEQFKSSVDWANAYANGDNIWNPVFIDELEPYTVLRFMDWGATNNSTITSWSQRNLPSDPDNASIGTSGGAGLAYEWMIDLCNRTEKDMWVCLPHQTSSNYWTNLAQLIYNNLDPSLKVYVEYSNETWNGMFDQFDYTINQGVAGGLPGYNQWYQGGAYSVYQSINIFHAFENVFGVDSPRLVKVIAASGNLDIADTAISNVVNSSTWNPNGVTVDAFANAPYVGSGLDGADSNIASQFRAATDSRIAGSVADAADIADTHNLDLITYEAGQHLTTNAHIWSADPDIYDEYIYMLNEMDDHFSLFMHYTNVGTWSSGGAWGAKDFTGQSPAQAHKYRALVDYAGTGGGSGGGGGAEVIIDNTDSEAVSSGFWGNQTWGSGFYGSNWAYRDASTSGTATGSWNVDFSGTYEVFVRAGGGNATTNQPFRVVHTGGTSSWTAVDMVANSGNWVSIGTYTLDSNSYVETNNDYAPQGSTRAIFDAVRFVESSSGGGGSSTDTLNPTADRDSQSSGSGTNATIYASQWNTMMFKFDLSSVGNSVSSATLRIYKPSSSNTGTVSAYAGASDSWSESSGTTSSTGSALDSNSFSTGAGWYEFDVTSLVDSEASGDDTVTITINTDVGGWTSFSARESSNSPELEVISQ